MCIQEVQHYRLCGHQHAGAVKQCVELRVWKHTPQDGVYRRRILRPGRCPRCEFEHNVPFLRARARILSDPHAVTYPERTFVSPYIEGEKEKTGKRGWWPPWGRRGGSVGESGGGR